MPQVSIIIINYNTYTLTSKCIESIYAHTKKINFELILIDNGSTECSALMFKEKFPKIILIENEINSGFSKGNNLGIDIAKGEVILLLNSDTELTEDSISLCYDQLRIQNAGVVTCKLIYPNNKLQHNCQSFPSALKLLLEKIRFHKFCSKKFQSRYFQGIYWDYSNPGFPDWIWGTFFMFKREVLLKLPNKKLNDDFFMYLEDMKWCWDIRKSGIKIFFTPKTSVIHHSGASLGKENNQVIKNQQFFLENNYSILQRTSIKVLELLKNSRSYLNRNLLFCWPYIFVIF